MQGSVVHTVTMSRFVSQQTETYFVIFFKYFLLLLKGAVVLEEFTSKNLQNTLDKLMTDCDRRQSMVQELISSSQRIQSVFHVTLSI